ncbi:MAG: putative PEP-binding protein, partial [Polyangiales bacterium]
MTRPLRVRGVAASIGVAIGPARLVFRGSPAAAHAPISQGDVGDEVARFRRAVQASCEEIEKAKDELTTRHGASDAAILDVYLLMHRDPLLIEATTETITTRRINAPWALARVVEKLKAPLLRDSSVYFRERAQDIDHMQAHLLRHLSGGPLVDPKALGPCVLFAHDLSPADAVHMLAPPTVGLVTEAGGASSHTAILARTFGVPAVAGAGPLSVSVRPGETVVVDGFSGEVIVGPRQEEQDAAARTRTMFLDFLSAQKSSRAVTRDGIDVSVAANIELPSEIEAAVDHGAEGIGLYRTEFMCLGQLAPPTEDEQAAIYERVSSAVAPYRTVFRTFDWRDDKRLRFDRLQESQRLWIRSQIRAVLRGNVGGGAALMFPMIATVDEFRAARALVDACAT